MNLLSHLRRALWFATSPDPRLAEADIPPLSEARLPADAYRVIAAAGSNSIVQKEPNADRWAEQMGASAVLAETLRAALSGQTLIDLGASERWQGMYALAKSLGAKRYIAVDRFFESKRRGNISVVRTINDAKCPATIIKADALEFLMRLPAASCSVAANALDGAVINSAEYHRLLAGEIQRVVPSGSLALGILSQALSLIATGAINDQEVFDNPYAFIRYSSGVCCRPGNNNSQFWNDLSPYPTDRLLIRK